MAARRRLLTGFHSSILTGRFRTCSWGPFGLPMRLVHIRLWTNDTTDTRTGIGLFVTSDPNTPTGVIVNPFTPPSGWTPLTEPSLDPATNSGEPEAKITPFGIQGNQPYELADVNLLFAGAPVYLKALIRNVTAGSIVFHVALVVEEAPDVDPTSITPREQPGGIVVPTTPVASPLGQPGASPTAGAPAAPPLPTKTPLVLGPQGPTKPPVYTMGPFTIDARDPFESARQAFH
jgi:hypothetical protein